MGSNKRCKKNRANKARGFLKRKVEKGLNSTQQQEISYTAATSTCDANVETVDPSNSSEESDPEENEENFFGFYFLMNSDILMSILLLLCRCPDCDSAVNISYLSNKKRGFALFFSIKCNRCSWENIFCSSIERDSGKRDRKSYDINIRTLLAFREIGLGYSNIKKFCNVMNMTSPMSKSSFEILQCRTS